MAKVDGKSALFINQRGQNKWNGDSFSPDHIYQVSPVRYVDTPILQVDPETGIVLNKFGSNLLLLPHGLSVENRKDGSPKALWLTDVALHQVMRFEWGKWTEPSLVLGQKLQPGNDQNSFCQPTDVAVSSNVSLISSSLYLF